MLCCLYHLGHIPKVGVVRVELTVSRISAARGYLFRHTPLLADQPCVQGLYLVQLPEAIEHVEQLSMPPTELVSLCLCEQTRAKLLHEIMERVPLRLNLSSVLVHC